MSVFYWVLELSSLVLSEVFDRLMGAVCWVVGVGARSVARRLARHVDVM